MSAPKARRRQPRGCTLTLPGTRGLGSLFQAVHSPHPGLRTAAGELWGVTGSGQGSGCLARGQVLPEPVPSQGRQHGPADLSAGVQVPPSGSSLTFEDSGLN